MKILLNFIQTEVAAAAEEEEFSEEVIQRPPEIEPEEEVPPPPATPPKDFDANSLNNVSVQFCVENVLTKPNPFLCK